MEKLQQKIHYKFNNISLLKEALTHRSFGKHNNERLEFLGDSILGAIIAQEIYKIFNNIDEGKLSRLKSHLVRGTTLAEIASELNIANNIILGKSEIKSGGYNRNSILADTFEAIIGAIVIDSNFTNAQKSILKIYNNRLINLELNMNLKDNKTILQEYLQKHKNNLANYQLVKTTGKDHNAIFTIKCHLIDYNLTVEQSAKSIKKAEQSCAKILLSHLL